MRAKPQRAAREVFQGEGWRDIYFDVQGYVEERVEERPVSVPTAIDSAAVNGALRQASCVVTVSGRTVDMRGEEYRRLRAAFDARGYHTLSLDGRLRDVLVHECEEHLGSLTATFKLLERPPQRTEG